MFNQPHLTGNELTYIADAIKNNKLSGDGEFTKRCHHWLECNTNCAKALLTHSCTAALEISALLFNIHPGDEVIMPSYTFVSTANAFVLRGAVPVFVDIRRDTLNLNEHLIEAAITPRTKAIIPMHYAGVGCEMDAIMDIASRYQLYVIEDAAQGIMADYKGRALGSIGHLGTYSFHDTKNIIAGEGGALLVNEPGLASRAEIIREKGTDRSRFLRSEVDKYTWQDIGSSFLPSELTAAFLYAQLENAKTITEMRLNSWNYYHELLKSLEDNELLRRPIIPLECQHNAHMYYVLLNSKINRHAVITELKRLGIHAYSHYVPLHLSAAGQKFSRAQGALKVTREHSECLLRLPLWVGLTKKQQETIVEVLRKLMHNQLRSCKSRVSELV